MAVLDTQVKNKSLPGDYGYVISAKKQNLKYAFVLLGVCIIVYVVGILFFDELTPFFTIVSVFLILPTAQFIAKYISFSKYKTLNKEEFNKMNSISEDFLVLGELPIIRGKKVYQILLTVVTKVGVFSYIEPLRDVDASRKERLDTEHALNTIVKPRNLGVSVKVYDDLDRMYDYLRTTVKSTAFSPNEKTLGEVARLFLLKTH